MEVEKVHFQRLSQVILPTQLPQEKHIFKAKIFHPITAKLVQNACPTIAPIVTPYGSLCAANAIVVICDRSPHSAKNVSTNASKKIGVDILLKIF